MKDLVDDPVHQRLDHPALVGVERGQTGVEAFELGLGDDRTEIHPTRVRRALTRAPIARREGPSQR